jgi:hypothetical protein
MLLWWMCCVYVIMCASCGIGGLARGSEGNKCHVDCSNKGVCDHMTGTCKCFDGYYGNNCGKRAPVDPNATQRPRAASNN